MIIDPFRFRPPDAEIVYCGYHGKVTFASTVTISSIAIGDEASDRVVLLGVLKSAAPEYRTLSSASIGGVAATIQAKTESGVAGYDVYWLSAPVPTGTTATVSLVFSGGTSGGGSVYVSSFAAYKLQSLDPIDVHTEKQTGSGSSAVQTYNVGVERGGIVLFAAWATIYQDIKSLNLSGVGEDFIDMIFAGSGSSPNNQFFLGGCAAIDADDGSYEIKVTSPDLSYKHYDYSAAVSFR